MPGATGAQGPKGEDGAQGPKGDKGAMLQVVKALKGIGDRVVLRVFREIKGILVLKVLKEKMVPKALRGRWCPRP